MSREFKDVNAGKPIASVGGQGHESLQPNKPIAHVTSPDGAKQVIRTEGEFGDKVALACFSVSNFGVFSSSAQGVGLFAHGANVAAQFDGDIEVSTSCSVGGTLTVTGDIFCAGDIQLTGRDYAENFTVADTQHAVPGSVMVLDDNGGVRLSEHAYDRRVAGVVSGAGECRPAIVLGHDAANSRTRPLALMGTVYCMADASTAAIGVGDMLTTSAIPGHAMKATDATRAFGAVIGKALRPLQCGRGLVPILVALQ